MLNLLGMLIAGGLAPASECTPATADRVAIREIALKPRKYVGRCVTVTGPADPVSVYHDKGSMERIVRAADADRSGLMVAYPDRLGVYGEGFRFSNLHGPPQSWVITGVISTCERKARETGVGVRKNSEGGMIVTLMAGYCHSHDGPIIEAVNFSVAGMSAK